MLKRLITGHRAMTRRAVDLPCAGADCYVKINAAPFLLALDLHGLIEPENVHVTIDRTAHQLSMRLPKAEVSSWPGLTMSGSAAEVTSRREASIQRRTEALEKVGVAMCCRFARGSCA